MPTVGEVQATFRHCLEQMDVGTAHKMWAELFPGYPQPKNYAETREMLHVARTQAESCKLVDRLYSHHWLTERDLPSKLPDKLRPWWDGTKIVSAVGLVIHASNPRFEDRAVAIRKAMEKGIMEMYDAGITDPEKVSEHMWFRAAQVREW